MKKSVFLKTKNKNKTTNSLKFKYDVALYEVFDEEKGYLRKSLPRWIHAKFTSHTIQESGDLVPDASLVCIRTQSIIPLEWPGLLEGILTRSTGYDHVNQFASILTCGNLPLYCSSAVAEHALLLWLSLLRKLPLQIKQFANFNRHGLTGSQLENKVVLIAGIGNIGHEIYKLAQHLGMKPLGVDIVKRFTDVTYVPIGKGMKTADIVVCAMNLTQINAKYFDYARLKQAKKGTLFINISRGELSPIDDLLRLINENHLGGIGLDVYDQESIVAKHLRENRQPSKKIVNSLLELHKKHNVIFTPHNAFNTHEALAQKTVQSIEQIVNFLKYKKFLWTIPDQD